MTEYLLIGVLALLVIAIALLIALLARQSRLNREQDQQNRRQDKDRQQQKLAVGGKQTQAKGRSRKAGADGKERVLLQEFHGGPR